MTSPILELDGFSLARGGRDVLRDVTFAVARGERVALLGPNGAGKTTLLQSLNRILTGGRGRLAVDGRPLASYSQRELARRLAYVPQADNRPTPFTVREFVGMARYAHLGPMAPVGPEDRRAIERALADAELLPLADRALDTLSGGERQKGWLAAALAQEADVLLLDEPTAFLDPPRQAEILRTLGRVHAERGTTMLFVTHDLNVALGHATRAIALREGAVAFDGPIDALLQGDVLRAVYAHEFVIGTHPRTGRPVVLPG